MECTNCQFGTGEGGLLVTYSRQPKQRRRVVETETLNGTNFLVHANAILEQYLTKRESLVARTGKAPIMTRGLLPRRNDPCPCGSGAKYKKCCRLRVPYVNVPQKVAVPCKEEPCPTINAETN